MKNAPMNRRKFLRASTLTAASFGLLPGLAARAAETNAPAGVHSRVISANDDIRMAVVGFNGRGKDHIKGWQETKGVRLVALCDVDKSVLDREVKKLQDKNEAMTGYSDLRRLLEDKD